MTDEAAPEVPPLEAVVQAAAKSHLLDNLAKARAAKLKKREERLLTQAEDKAEMRKPGDPQNADGPNLAEVEQLAATYPQVSIDVRKIINNVPKVLNDDYVVPTKELYAFTKHLAAMAGGGGGLYKCRVRNPDNMSEVLYTFRMAVTGPSNPLPQVQQFVQPSLTDPLGQPQFVAAPAQALPTTHTPHVQEPMQYPPGALPPLPPQYRSMSPEQQWSFYMAQQAMTQRQGGTYSSDQLAMHQVNTLMAEKAKLEAERATLQAKFEASQRETTTQLAALKADLERSREAEAKRADKAEAELREARIRADADKRDAEHKAEMQKIQASIDSLKAAPATKAAPEASGLGTMVPFIPVIIEFMRMNNAKTDAERAQSFENTKLLLGTMKKEGTGIEGEAMKYMVEILKSRADEKTAQTESTVMMLGAITQMMKDMAPEAEPAWMEFARIALAGVAPGLQKMITSNVALPGDAPAKQLPQGDGSHHAEVVGPPSLDEQRAIQQWQIFKAANEEVAKILYAAYQHPMMPPEMHTAEWRLILFNLHMRVDIDKHVMLFVDHLEVQRQLNLLPQVLTNVFSKPQAILEPIIKAFPIWTMDQAYAEEFLNEVVAEITDREEERIKVELEEAEEEATETKGEAVVS